MMAYMHQTSNGICSLILTIQRFQILVVDYTWYNLVPIFMLVRSIQFFFLLVG